MSEKNNVLRGSWEFDMEPDGVCDTIVQYNGCPILTVRGTDDMTCIDEDDVSDIAEDCKRIAFLVRAAPDMLFVLENLIYLADKLWTSTKHDNQAHPVIENAKKAIAKAKGEKP